MTYTDIELLEDLQSAAQMVDGELTKEKYKTRMNLNGLAHPETIVERFDGWVKAKRIAGVK